MKGKCKDCGAEITYIQTPIGVVACDAEEVLYWNDEADILLMTPNGEQFWGCLDGDLAYAAGIGHKVHICLEKNTGMD